VRGTACYGVVKPLMQFVCVRRSLDAVSTLSAVRSSPILIARKYLAAYIAGGRWKSAPDHAVMSDRRLDATQHVCMRQLAVGHTDLVRMSVALLGH